MAYHIQPRPSSDKTDRYLRRVARTKAKIARQVAEATKERAEMVGEALDTLREVYQGAESDRDRRLAANDALHHFRAVSTPDKAGDVNIDARQQVISDPETVRALLAPDAQARLNDRLDAMEREAAG